MDMSNRLESEVYRDSNTLEIKHAAKEMLYYDQHYYYPTVF